jgi:hypothetical protein
MNFPFRTQRIELHHPKKLDIDINLKYLNLLKEIEYKKIFKEYFYSYENENDKESSLNKKANKIQREKFINPHSNYISENSAINNDESNLPTGYSYAYTNKVNPNSRRMSQFSNVSSVYSNNAKLKNKNSQKLS